MSLLFIILITPLLGWLAFVKFGIFSVMRFGNLMMFLSGLAINVTILFENIFSTSVSLIIFTLFVIIFVVGASAISVNIVHFGLDQMPDASSSSITSFIVWLVFSCCTGVWVTNVLYGLYWICYENNSERGVQVWCLISVLSVSIILASFSILKSGWLIVNKPKPNKFKGIKIIYKVLKYAAKHKVPVNRSAFTYWEENIPSRIDLGKARFGGPFTTEQVENVKTALRLLVVSLALWVVSFGSAMIIEGTGILSNNTDITPCESFIINCFSFDCMWYLMVITVLFEFVFYPLFSYKLPTILKRIGIIALILTISSMLCLALELIRYYDVHVPNWSIYAVSKVSQVISLFLVSAVLEFVCAQAPYNMKVFFISYGVVIFFIPNIIGLHIPMILRLYSKQNTALIILGIKGGITLFGFILYCLLARWYKMRVRDEEYYIQTVVEEVYDRYLSSEQKIYRSRSS